MATVRYWLGDDTGNEGDMSVAANYSPSGVPADTDLLVFDGRSAGQNAGSGLDQTTIDLGAFIELASYTGQIGTEANPLAIEVSGPIILRGSGDKYLMCAGNNAAPAGVDAEIERLIIDVPSSTKVDICSASNDATFASVFTLIQLISGQVNVRGASGATTTPARDAAGTCIKELLLTPLRQSLTNPFVNIEDGCFIDNDSDLKMNITMTGGQIVTASDYVMIDNMGGKVTKIG